MAFISANSADAIIAYDGTWDDRAPNARYAGAPWSSATLVFNGTSFKAYGLFNSTNAIYTCNVDGEQRDSTTASFQPSSDVNQPFLEITNLNSNTHTVTLNITGGALGLSRMEWYNAQASNNSGSAIRGSTDSTGAWTTLTTQDGTELSTTSTASASIVFNFQGTGLTITGITGPSAGVFNVVLDGMAPITRNAWTQFLNHSAVLHRSDGLPAGDHTITLTNVENRLLQVGQAQPEVQERKKWRRMPRLVPTATVHTTTSKANENDSARGILSLPVEVLAQIAKHVPAVELVDLARTCRLFRQVLMRRSARPIWQAALRNIPGLPPCPDEPTEPQYVVFLLTDYCTSCGKSTDHRPEINLFVKFCRECRKKYLVRTNDIKNEALRELVHQSVARKGKTSYCLKSDKEAVEKRGAIISKRRKPNATDESWVSEMKQAREEREQSLSLNPLRFATMLREFEESEIKKRSEEFYSNIKERRAEVKRRLRFAGWEPSDWLFPFEVTTQWVNIVEDSEPVTDRLWERLYPKLVPYLEENRQLRQADDQQGLGQDQRRQLCRLLVPIKKRNVLVKINQGNIVDAFHDRFFERDDEMDISYGPGGNDSQVPVSDSNSSSNSDSSSGPEPDSGSDSDSDSDSSGESASHTSESSHVEDTRLPDFILRRPGPPMAVAVAMPIVFGLLEGEAAGDGIRERFEDAQEEIVEAFDSWSSSQERKLVSMLLKASISGARGVPSGFGERDRLELFCAVPHKYNGFPDDLPRNARILLRADSVFRFANDDPCPPPAYYPEIFDMYQNQVQGYFDSDEMPRLLPKLGYPWSSKSIECYPIGVAAARALLSDLSIPDAAQFELQAMGQVFSCERCGDGWMWTWNEIVHHYAQSDEHARLARDQTRSGGQKLVYNDIHDLLSIVRDKGTKQPKRLVEAHSLEESIYFVNQIDDQASLIILECNLHEIQKPQAKYYTRMNDGAPPKMSITHVEYVSDSSESDSDSDDRGLKDKKRYYGSRVCWLDPRIRVNSL
ncbi:F-box-like protein [Ceratobasidium sp. AG-Ba]|nr:F-box-like protein [Ceratobasidium sp. AG-Ba]